MNKTITKLLIFKTSNSSHYICPRLGYHVYYVMNCRICLVTKLRLRKRLRKRGYSRTFVTKQIRRPADIPRRLTLQTKDVNKPKFIPFITTFNPSLPHISNIIKKHYNLLLSSNRCKNAFQHLPVVACRRSPNLRDLLVTAKLSSNSAKPQLPSGSFRCGRNCATCPYISHGLTTYTFFSTGETRPIKSNLACDTKNLIYTIQCNRCNYADAKQSAL